MAESKPVSAVEVTPTADATFRSRTLLKRVNSVSIPGTHWVDSLHTLCATTVTKPVFAV